MKISITYEIETAYGHKRTHGVVAHTFKDAEELCQNIEKLGCKILDVTREE